MSAGSGTGGVHSASTPEPKLEQIEHAPLPAGRSPAQRRWDMEQALANTRISGHVPTPEYLADWEALVNGQITAEELRRRIVERAHAMDSQAQRGGSEEPARS